MIQITTIIVASLLAGCGAVTQRQVEPAISLRIENHIQSPVTIYLAPGGVKQSRLGDCGPGENCTIWLRKSDVTWILGAGYMEFGYRYLSYGARAMQGVVRYPVYAERMRLILWVGPRHAELYPRIRPRADSN